MSLIERKKPLFFKKHTQDAQKKNRCDPSLLILILILSAFGSLMVFSASYAYAERRYGDSFYFIKRQILWLFVGLVAMFLTSRLSIATLKKAAPFAYLFTVVSLILVPIIGTTAGGARRWISIGGLSFQPSEFAKMTLILMLAYYFERKREKILAYDKPRESITYGALIPFALIGAVCGLVMLQKHLSGLIILGAIGILVMFLAGTNPKILGSLALMGVAAVSALALFTDYTKRRILIWLNPELYPLDGGWQTLQGMMAIGSGGFFGLGFGNSRLKFSYVSEPQNDFIFTITCEELGFLGALSVILLFTLFVARASKLALNVNDPFAKIVGLGLGCKVALQVLLNIAVVTNTIPNTGISLPFFSYGGSSLVMLFTEMGILLAISKISNTGR